MKKHIISIFMLLDIVLLITIFFRFASSSVETSIVNEQQRKLYLAVRLFSASLLVLGMVLTLIKNIVIKKNTAIRRYKTMLSIADCERKLVRKDLKYFTDSYKDKKGHTWNFCFYKDKKNRVYIAPEFSRLDPRFYIELSQHENGTMITIRYKKGMMFYFSWSSTFLVILSTGMVLFPQEVGMYGGGLYGGIFFSIVQMFTPSMHNMAWKPVNIYIIDVLNGKRET